MTERKRVDPLALAMKLADQGKQLVGTNFLAPLVAGGKVRVRIAGIVCELQTKKAPPGWGVFEVVSSSEARFVEPAPAALIAEYLKLFPRVRLVLLDEFDGQFFALAAAPGTGKVNITGPVPVALVERAAAFQTIYARFDGSLFLFESADRRRNPAVARQLRQALADDVKPDEVRCSGMLPAERVAYRMLWLRKHDEGDDNAQDDKSRITRALKHAGARLDAYWVDDGGTLATVRYEAGGAVHTVNVLRDDLTLVSAGVCLQGMERSFDLTSVVSVLESFEAHGGERGAYYLDEGV